MIDVVARLTLLGKLRKKLGMGYDRDTVMELHGLELQNVEGMNAMLHSDGWAQVEERLQELIASHKETIYRLAAKGEGQKEIMLRAAVVESLEIILAYPKSVMAQKAQIETDMRNIQRMDDEAVEYNIPSTSFLQRLKGMASHG